MTDHEPNDLSHLSDAEFNALCPQGEHAPGPAVTDLHPWQVSTKLQPPIETSILFRSPSAGEEVIRLDKEGFHYRGQFIEDAGEARRLFVEFLRQDVLTAAICNGPELEYRIAAAFRAVADQAHPKAHIEDINYVHQNYVDGWKDALDVILAIADELEGQ